MFNLNYITMQVQEIGKIYATRNYELFSFFPGNRDIVEPHLRKLKKSFDREKVSFKTK